MAEYGPLLKKLINFSGLKMSTVAGMLSYDLSYISKWCNGAKLPAARIAPEINRSLAAQFSREINARGNAERFCKSFSVSGNDLEALIYGLLDEAYRDSELKSGTGFAGIGSAPARILTQASDIYDFFHREFMELVCAGGEAAEILCTLDLSRFLSSVGSERQNHQTVLPDIHVKMGLCPSALSGDSRNCLKNLYAFLNIYHTASFDLYDNSLMSTMNTIVVRGKFAVLCALDQYDRITTAVVIQDEEKVNQIYLKLIPVFRTSPLMLHHEGAASFNKSGYRTDFYARENYQIFTARGFEFLLPVECWKSIIQAAAEKGDGGFEARIVEKMQITWEEIFEKSSMDFFTTKSALLKYLEDGEIIFLDVVYNMSVPERKLHIQKVLDITKKNPNIHFYVIDDDCLPDMQHLFGASIYSNRKKIFLKNFWSLRGESEAQFYCIDSEQMVGEIVHFFDALRDSAYCYAFDGSALQRFADRYGSMINRMLDLNEEKK